MSTPKSPLPHSQDRTLGLRAISLLLARIDSFHRGPCIAMLREIAWVGDIVFQLHPIQPDSSPPPHRPFSRGFATGVVSKRVVLADVPRYQKPERGYIWMFPGTKNRNQGTFRCFPVPKTETRVHLPKPPFDETAL